MTDYEQERQERENRNNARRLAYALYQRAEDECTVERLARILHYMPEQLAIDMKCLFAMINEMQETD